VECALTYGDPWWARHRPQPGGPGGPPGAGGRRETHLAPAEEHGIAGIALEMSGKAAQGQGYSVAEEILRSGKALEKLRQIIEIQGAIPGSRPQR